MPDISDFAKEVAALFGQSEAFAQAVINRHGITSLPKFRTADDGLNAFYSDITSVYNDQPSMTKQEFTKSCDPNYIVDLVLRGKDVEFKGNAFYGDFSDLPTDYHTALNIVTQANQSFMQLPADMRSKFDNDPGQFLEFVNDPANAQALIDMGLAVERKVTKESPKVTKESPVPASAPASEGAGEGA